MSQVLTNTTFYCKDGSLTSYAFSCGYVQKEVSGSNYKTLYKEHNSYHLIMMRNDNRVIWLSYDSNELQKAKKDFSNTSLN